MKLLGPSAELDLVDLLEREIDSTYVTYKQRVARQDEPIIDQKTHMLGCVTGSMEHADSAVADLDHIAFREWFESVADPGTRAESQCRAQLLRELTGTGRMVCVDVGVDHIRDAQPMLLRDRDVIRRACLRVDDRNNAFAGTADEVRGTGTLFVKELPEDHLYPAFPSIGRNT
jgi:hypothetical protein